jgi:hypothetical protein
MLRSLSRVVGLVVALGLVGEFGPSASQAQYGGGGGGFNPGFDPSMMPGFGYEFGPDVAPRSGKTPAPNPVLQLLALVNHPLVQEELKLTDDQKAKLKDLASKRAPAGTRKPSSGSSKAVATSSRPKSSGGSTTPGAISFHQKQLDDLLDADQRKRLEQISLQIDGPLAVAKPEVAKKINLSAAQLKQVRSIGVEMRNQLAELGPVNPPPGDKPPPGDEPAESEKTPDRVQFEQVREAAGARVMKLLKPTQKDAFNQLLGPTFEVAKLRTAPASTEGGGPETRPNAKPKSRGPLRKSGGRSASQ